MDTIGKRIRYLRSQENISMSKLGEEIGTKSSAISAWENDQKQPSAPMIVALAQFFNVSTDWILTGTEHNRGECLELTLEEEEMIRIIRELDERDQIEIATITRMKRDLRKSISSLQKEQTAQEDSKQDTTSDSEKSST